MEYGISNMKVKELRDILEHIEDQEMDVIIPIITEDDANHIVAFRHVRTAGILSCSCEEKPAFCLNGAADGADIDTQIGLYPGDVICDKVMF